jgi:hypothetical protein
MHLFSQIVYSCKTLYVFGLPVHHQELKTGYRATVYVKQLLLPAAIRDEMELQAVPSHPDSSS